MGWFEEAGLPEEAADLIAADQGVVCSRLLRQEFGPGWVLWAIHQLRDGRKMIVAHLLDATAEGSTMRKIIGEDEGPAETNCPASFLSRASDFANHRGAAEWRQRVRHRGTA